MGIGMEDPDSDGAKLVIIKSAGNTEKLQKVIEKANIQEREARNSVAMAHTRYFKFLI